MNEPAVKKPRCRVLVVARSDEARLVITTVLRGRGIATAEADSAAPGLQLLERDQPRLVVLDSDAEPLEDPNFGPELSRALQASRSDLLVLGRISHLEGELERDHVFEKPYHYGPLIRTIEQLLSQ